MFGIFKGDKPDITPAQVIGLLIPGVPVVSKFLAAFGIVTFSAVQQQTLTDTLIYGGGVAAALFVGDAVLRNGRSKAQATRDAAVLVAPAPDDRISQLAQAVGNMSAVLEQIKPSTSGASFASTNAVLSEPHDLVPVERAATPVEGVPAADEALVSDDVELASPPPPLGAPADPDPPRRSARRR